MTETSPTESRRAKLLIAAGAQNERLRELIGEAAHKLDVYAVTRGDYKNYCAICLRVAPAGRPMAHDPECLVARLAEEAPDGE